MIAAGQESHSGAAAPPRRCAGGRHPRRRPASGLSRPDRRGLLVRRRVGRAAASRRQRSIPRRRCCSSTPAGIFAETLAYRDALAVRLGLRDVRSIGPTADEVARLDADTTRAVWDPDGCCAFRKAAPLQRALAFRRLDHRAASVFSRAARARVAGVRDRRRSHQDQSARALETPPSSPPTPPSTRCRRTRWSLTAIRR